MTYKQWYKNHAWLGRDTSLQTADSDYSAKAAWDHQQTEIDRLDAGITDTKKTINEMRFLLKLVDANSFLAPKERDRIRKAITDSE